MPNQSQDYKKLKLLGQGTYGKAFLVERKSDEMAHMTEEERKEAQKEANILQILNHQNIIKYHEQYKTKKGRLCIVMDYAEGGDLNQVITKAKSFISEDQILNWLLQLSCALNFVHTKNIIHRDIKAQNIFLTANNIVKLADFGIARVLSCTRDKAQTFIGTPYYLAPELVDSKPYSTKADIWSLGVLIYHLCALKPPFEAESIPTLMLKISRGQFPPIPQFYSKELRNLVIEMLTVDPNQRPSALQILEKPLIKNRAMSFLSETIAFQQQDADQLAQKQNNQINQQKQLQKNQNDKKNHYNLQDNDRRYGFKEIQKSNANNNVPQTRFYSPQHNNEQRGYNIGFNQNQQKEGFYNNGEKSSCNELPIIGCDDYNNRPKTKNEALKYFKGQDEYYKQNQNQHLLAYDAQGNQEGKRQLIRVESLNEFSSNNNIGSNNNLNNNPIINNNNQNKNKNGLVKQPSLQSSQQENHQQLQQKQQENQGITNQNYPKKSFRVHSPVHHKMPSPTNRFNDNKQQNYNGINLPHRNQNSVNQNFNNANENNHSNQDNQNFNNNNKGNNQDPSQGQNILKNPISNNYLASNNNQNNINQPSSFNNNYMDQQVQNNINNHNIPSQQVRIGSPGTRLPQLNYQPPVAKVKHGQNFSYADNISTPQINQRRNLEKIQKPSILNNKNSELPSPKNFQRPPSAVIGLGNYNHLKNGIQNKNLNNQLINQVNNQDCSSPNSNNLNNLNKQHIFPNNPQQIIEEVQKNPNNIREHLQSANPLSQQAKLNKIQQQPLSQYQIQQINSQQQQVQNNQNQSTKETQKSEESQEEDQYQLDSNNPKLYQQILQNPSGQQQNQQKKFVIKKGAAQVFGLQIPLAANINQISSNQRVSSQPDEDTFNQPPSYLVNFNTQPAQNIHLLSVESADSSQRNTPKNGSENMTQATANSCIVNTQQLKKSDFSQISATQASLYEATQASKLVKPQSQSGLEDGKTGNKNIQSIKSINSSDNIDHLDTQFKASSSTSSQNSQQKVIQSKNILQSVSKQEFSEIKGKRKESQSDEDIRIFDSVDSQKSVKTPTNIPPQSQFSQNGNNQQNAHKLAATDEIDSNKKPSPLFSSNLLNSDHDKETKVERKLIVKFPIPFQESQNKHKEKDKKKNKNTEISPELKKENEEQETDLEKLLNELNQMLTGNYDEQIQNLYTNGFELDTIEDKDDYLDEEEIHGNNNFNNLGQSPSNNIGNNQKQVNFGSANISNNINCISPGYQNKQNKLLSNINSVNNLSVASNAFATSNTAHSDILTNSEDRVKQLRQSLQKEIGTIHFSKVYKLAVASLSNIQQPLESSEFYLSLKIMFPSINHQEIQRYTTLFHTLVMLEQD